MGRGRVGGGKWRLMTRAAAAIPQFPQVKRRRTSQIHSSVNLTFCFFLVINSPLKIIIIAGNKMLTMERGPESGASPGHRIVTTAKKKKNTKFGYRVAREKIVI